MLVIIRRIRERIFAGHHAEIVFTVLGIQNGHVRIGIEAPLEVPVHREEIYDRIANSQQSQI